MNGEVVPDVTQLDGSWYYMPAMTHAAVESVSDRELAARAAVADSGTLTISGSFSAGKRLGNG